MKRRKRSDRQCEAHPHRPALAYCHGCGVFGCRPCLPVTDISGNRYCLTCADRNGIAVPTRQLRDRCVVRFKDGQRMYGAISEIDLKRPGFFLSSLRRERSDPERVYILFEEIKAVFRVRDLRGQNHHPPRYLTPSLDDPDEVAVHFSDGEVIRGHAAGGAAPSTRERFELIPRDPDDNNTKVIVEPSAVDHIQIGLPKQVSALHSLVSDDVRRRILLYYWRHRGAVVPLQRLAVAIDRAVHTVEENLEPFIRHSLVERHKTALGCVLRLNDLGDPTIRAFVRGQYEEISRDLLANHRARAEVGSLAL